MKTIVNAFFIVIAFLLGILDSVAKNNPPVTNPNGRTNGFVEHPGLPINEHLFYLLILAVFFGIYIIYTCKLNTKSPI